MTKNKTNHLEKQKQRISLLWLIENCFYHQDTRKGLGDPVPSEQGPISRKWKSTLLWALHLWFQLFTQFTHKQTTQHTLISSKR